MKTESKLFIDLWDNVREMIPASKRTDIAMAMLQTFIDHGDDLSDFSDIIDEEASLSKAYDLLNDEDPADEHKEGDGEED